MRTYPDEQRQQAQLFTESLLSFGGCSVTRFLSGGQRKTELPTVTNLKTKESRSLSRSSDPITSKVAGEKTKEFRIRHASKILASLKEFGPMNYKEIAEKTGFQPVQVARRRNEMENKMKVIEVLEETRNGCALWKAK